MTTLVIDGLLYDTDKAELLGKTKRGPFTYSFYRTSKNKLYFVRNALDGTPMFFTNDDYVLAAARKHLLNRMPVERYMELFGPFEDA